MVDVRTLPAGEDNEEIRVTLDELARGGARRMIAGVRRVVQRGAGRGRASAGGP